MKKIFCTASALALSTAMLTACGVNRDGVETITCLASEDIVSETAVTTEYVPVEAVYTTDEISGHFNAAFLKETLKQSENFVISPLSAKLALNMAAVGATENSATEQELLNIFGYGSSNEMKGDTKNLIDELDREDGTITAANSVWASDKLKTLSESYVQELNDVFGAESFTADLTSAEFMNDLNSWVDENTNGLIPKFLDKPLEEFAKLALVNTLYFNNEWVYKFDSYATQDRDFYGINGTEPVPTMCQWGLELEYAEGKKLKSVSLPYRDGSKMNVYLPINEEESIAEIIGEMSLDEISAELDSEYADEKVDIALPKFECEYSGSLIEMLQLLGVSQALDPIGAQFGKMSDEQLFISKVIQAAKIRCDEEGTEAAAATMVVAGDGAAIIQEPPIQFIVDRPFLYEIEAPSGETLFMGIIQSFS